MPQKEKPFLILIIHIEITNKGLLIIHSWFGHINYYWRFITEFGILAQVIKSSLILAMLYHDLAEMGCLPGGA